MLGEWSFPDFVIVMLNLVYNSVGSLISDSFSINKLRVFEAIVNDKMKRGLDQFIVNLIEKYFYFINIF